MAEVAAGIFAAEQVVATAAETAAIAAVMMPTLPVKLSLTRLSVPSAHSAHHPPLRCSHHTLTVINNTNDKALIFGGRNGDGHLCPPATYAITLPSSLSTVTSSPPPAPTTTNPTPTSEPTAAFTCYAPRSLQDADTGELLLPSQRTHHAACARAPAPGRTPVLLIHGGRDDAGNPIDDHDDDDGGGGGNSSSSCIWQWDWQTLKWSKLRGSTQLGEAMAPRWGHWMLDCSAGDVDSDAAARRGDGYGSGDAEGRAEEKGFLVVVGGKGGGGRREDKDMGREAWMYDFHALAWTRLPSVPDTPLAAAHAGGRVYVISGGGSSASSGEGGGTAARARGKVHYLDMRGSAEERAKPGALVWKTVEFGTDPAVAAPTPRAGGALVPLTAGHGRDYLAYMFGCSEEEEGDEGGAVPKEREFYSDIWTLQLPTRGLNPAAAKDRIRDKLPGMESGEFRWAEAEIVPTEQMTHEGKAHPGPRAWFGADSCLGGKGVVIWGGVNPKGEREGDGWILRLAHGYADHDRWE